MKQVDIRGLKKWVRNSLGPKSRLCEVTQLEPDYLLPDEYLAKMSTWLKLYELEHDMG